MCPWSQATAARRRVTEATYRCRLLAREYQLDGIPGGHVIVTAENDGWIAIASTVLIIRRPGALCVQ